MTYFERIYAILLDYNDQFNVEAGNGGLSAVVTVPLAIITVVS